MNIFRDIFETLFPKKYDPDLIDLNNYAAELLLWKDKGVPPLPPPSIPGIAIGEWSCEEMEAMRKNRRLAIEIYEWIKG